MKRTILGLALVAALAVPMQTQAQVSVTYTVSGGSGSWFLDFAFTNLAGAGSLYFMGVDLPAGSWSGAPAGFRECGPDCSGDGTWTPTTTTYFTNWLSTGWPTVSDILSGPIAPGSTLSGFTATAGTLPTSVGFFGYTLRGSGDFSLYEGVATRVSVPEPGSMMLVATGLLGLVGVRRRRKSLNDEA